jgi:hypothetical protein
MGRIAPAGADLASADLVITRLCVLVFPLRFGGRGPAEMSFLKEYLTPRLWSMLLAMRNMGKMNRKFVAYNGKNPPKSIRHQGRALECSIFRRDLTNPRDTSKELTPTFSLAETVP